MAEMCNARLTVHCGARRIDRAGLALLPAPAALGPRHRPLSYHKLIEALTGVLGDSHLAIQKEDFAVYGEQAERFFGVMDLTVTSSSGMASLMRPESSFALGLRGSIDESLSWQVAVGNRVHLCDNMLFSGSGMIALKRKSTIGLNLDSELREAIERFTIQSATLVERLERAKTIILTAERAKAMIFDQFEAKTLPLHKLPKVAAWFFSPPAEATDVSEFPGSLYSLTQSFTRESRTLKPAAKFRASARIGKLLTAV